MFIWLSIIIACAIVYVMYLRYFPVKGIPCIDLSNNQWKQPMIKLDIRDYNASAKPEISGSISMPVAYLRRYHHQIPAKEIHLIASDRMEKNLAIRFLHNKGFKVIGYSLTDCGCKGKVKKVVL